MEVHFWMPVYRLNAIRINSSPHEKVLFARIAEEPNGFKDGPGGWLIDTDEYTDSGIPMIRATNVTEYGLNLNDVVYISEIKNDELKTTQIRPGDLLLTMRGTIGRATIVPDSLPNANMNAAVCRIRLQNREHNPYIRDFLNTAPGRLQSLRYGLKAVQGDLNLDAIRNFVIPFPTLPVQRDMVQELQNARDSRKDKLEKADALLSGLDAFLLECLSITIPDMDNRMTYSIKLASVHGSKQIGADYFHPERMNALMAIQKAKMIKRAARLDDVADFIREFSTEYEPADYLGLAGVQSQTGELVNTAEEPGKGQASIFEKNDVLFARLRPYLNKVWRAEHGGVCSTEFHVIRVKKTASDLFPAYLAAVLRSSIIVAQTKHMMTGNTHPRLANEDVVDLLIPIPDEKVQQKVVNELHRRRTEARLLRIEAEREWEVAKSRFEARLLGEEAKE
jgi:type I restriction enzyme S subunit